MLADQEGGAGGAVIGAVRVVLRGPAAELAPEERDDARAEVALLEVGWKAARPCATCVRLSAQRPALVRVGVELARRLQRDRADREAGVEQRGEARRAWSEVAVRDT